jgi:hypothetical protein
VAGKVELASLIVQLKRLHGSLRLADVLAAIDETVTNLIGSEDFGLFLRDDESGRYEKLFATGKEVTAMGDVARGDGGTAGRALATGKIHYGRSLAAVVPLKSGLGPGSVGLLVIARLLPHKPSVTEADRALLESFAEHAGVALEAALCAAEGPPKICVSELRARAHRRPHDIKPLGGVGP